MDNFFITADTNLVLSHPSKLPAYGVPINVRFGILWLRFVNTRAHQFCVYILLSIVKEINWCG